MLERDRKRIMSPKAADLPSEVKCGRRTTTLSQTPSWRNAINAGVANGSQPAFVRHFAINLTFSIDCRLGFPSLCGR